MEKKFTLLALLVIVFITGYSQQVPNGSFENWSNEFTPVGWTGVEVLLQDLIPFQSSYFTFRDTTTFTDGSTSIMVMADTIPGAPSFGVIPGVASLGAGFLNGTTPSFTGIPFIYRPDSIIFDYKFTSPGVDSGAASLTLSNNGNVLAVAPGRPALQTKLAPDSNWVHFAIDMNPYYVSGGYPDSLLIQFVSSTQSSAVFGSALHIDHVRFGYINPPVSVTTSGTTTFCTGDSVTLQAHTGTSTAYSYQWNLGGTPLTGATSSSYLAKSAGSYTVVIDSAGVTATSQPIVVTDTNCTTGIRNIMASDISVYPNPANSVLNISTNLNISGYGVSIFDIVGRLVAEQTLENGNNTINLSQLVDGTYICRITDRTNAPVTQKKFTVLK